MFNERNVVINNFSEKVMQSENCSNYNSTELKKIVIKLYLESIANLCNAIEESNLAFALKISIRLIS